MRIVFMGSAELACPALELLAAGERDELVGVVSQPDRPRGRNLRLSSCPVKAAATARGVPVFTPVRVNAAESLARLREWDIELLAVMAYGQILSKAVLDLPPRGCVNVHASLLPKYRGAAPIQWAIANGEHVTGVTTMMMSERMDAGDILLRREVPIGPADTAAGLHDRLAVEGASLLAATLDDIRAGRAVRTPQVEAEATFAPKLSKQDGRIAWTRPAAEIYNRIRAFNPWPTCFCRAPGRPGTGGGGVLKILAGRVEDAPGGEAGTVVDVSPDGPLVATGAGGLRLLQVQPEGRKAMRGGDYLHGHRLAPGDVFD